ncbi:acyl-CoA thioesterase [candidate division KSB1 bacterium]|nr:acyl-CoA thioesterase [candidate division KSB1 bacterium]
MNEKSIEELLRDFPVVVQFPVAWGEMDALGHVNNIVYFRYFESARVAYLTKINFIDPEANDGIAAILASTQCDFRKALAYPDTVSIGARVVEIGSDRFAMEYRLVSQGLQKIAAEGKGVVVAYNYRDKHKVELPEAIRKNIKEIEMLGPTIRFRIEVPVSVPVAEANELKNALQAHVEVRQAEAEALKLNLSLILEILATVASVIQAVDIIIGWIDRFKDKKLKAEEVTIVNARDERLDLQNATREQLMALLQKK